MDSSTCVYLGDALARYSFGESHPFGPKRFGAFRDEFYRQGLDKHARILEPVAGSDEQLLLFHTQAYLQEVKLQSKAGSGYLDQGDTPAFPGVYEAALTVVGTTLAGLDKIMSGECRHAFNPIGGLHHARRDGAAGFCVFNDCGIAIETLKKKYQLRRIAYVDIDAHHGDGVYYSFEDDPEVFIVDIHEDGRTLYPGTGHSYETGIDDASGTKLNIPMPMGADDKKFFEVWEKAEAFLEKVQPEVILFQCGADSLAGDPITNLQYTQAAHAHAAKRLSQLATRTANGRILTMGGGGYNLENIAAAWNAVIAVLTDR
jgi:acetoin utilization protein AcuC